VTTITSIHVANVSGNVPVLDGMLVKTEVKAQMRESKRFEKVAAALDFVESLNKSNVRQVYLNVDLSTAKYDKQGKLLEGDYPWVVSYPKKGGSNA